MKATLKYLSFALLLTLGMSVSALQVSAKCPFCQLDDEKETTETTAAAEPAAQPQGRDAVPHTGAGVALGGSALVALASAVVAARKRR